MISCFIEKIHELVEAALFLADKVLEGNLHVIQADLCGI